MWAMIGTCIVLAIWTAGLQWLHHRSNKKQELLVETGGSAADEETVIADEKM